MRKVLLISAAIAAMRCFGIAASQAWVTNYVSQSVSELERKITATSAGGVTSLLIGVDGGGVVSNVVEDATVGGLYIGDAQTAAVSAGITNGMLFAWNSTNAYVNGSHVILATKTNLTYSVYSTAEIGVETWLVDPQTNRFCRLYSTLIQPSVASRLIGGGQ